MHKELLDLILAQLAEDFPDTAKTYSAEVFADWLTGRFGKVGVLKCPSCGLADVSLHQCCHNSACTEYAEEHTVYEGWKTEDLSPTGRRPSQPELQHLPSASFKYADFLEFGQPLVPLTDTEIEGVKQRAKELLQQYLDTFSDISTPGRFPNFPNWPKWEHIGDRYTRAQKFYRATAQQVLQQERRASLNPLRTELFKAPDVEALLHKAWTHECDNVLTSFSPAEGIDYAVLYTTLREGDTLTVQDGHYGKAAVKLAREYLYRILEQQ